MVGLKRGEVLLCDHQPEWDEIAAGTIENLKQIFGGKALDIQHIGSTAIHCIKAKPIIDIALGVGSFNEIAGELTILNNSKKYQKSHNRFNNDFLYVINDGEGKRTHQIHILIFESPQWRNYVNFRDYMNAFPEKAKEYEALKLKLADECSNVQTKYTDGKQTYMGEILAEARAYVQSRKR